MLPWTFLESDKVLPKVFCEVLSRFQKIHETLAMTLAQFYIWIRFGIIGEPLKRLERKFRGRSGFGAVGALPLVRGTVRFLYQWLITHEFEHTQPSFPPSLPPSPSFLPPPSLPSPLPQEMVCGTRIRVKLFIDLIVVGTC